MSGTSNSYAFNPALSEIMLDAYERIGKLGVDLTIQGQELSSARRSMNFVLSSWANRGVNLWTVQLVSQVMQVGVNQYFDDASCIDILPDSVVVRQYPNLTLYETDDLGNLILDDQGNPILIVGPTSGQNSLPTDLLMYPLSRGDYQAIPNKLQQGRPNSFWIDRQVVPVINIYEVPQQAGYILRYYRSRQVQDADITSGQQLQVPYRFLEGFVSDLASHLAMKWAPGRLKDLAAYAQQEWDRASEEDTEKVSFFLVPDFSGYYD
jgi:hypothetical protein